MLHQDWQHDPTEAFPYQGRAAYVNTDGGRAESQHPDEDSDCAVRALALVTGMSYNHAWAIMNAAGREPGDGVYLQEFMRKVGWVYDPDTGQRWAFKWHGLAGLKGCPRITERTFPKLFPQGRYLVGTVGHVEAWMDGIMHEEEVTWERLDPGRCFYGAFACVPVLSAESLFMAWRCYVLHSGTPQATLYRSALGCVPAQSIGQAYARAADEWEHKLTGKRADLLVTPIDGQSRLPT